MLSPNYRKADSPQTYSMSIFYKAMLEMLKCFLFLINIRQLLLPLNGNRFSLEDLSPHNSSQVTSVT